jgi:hypothetical protein
MQITKHNTIDYSTIIENDQYSEGSLFGYGNNYKGYNSYHQKDFL